MNRLNEEWKSIVETKVAEVLADGSTTTDYAPGITSPDEIFAFTIDHTLLRPDATPLQIDQLCDEAIKYGFRVKTLPFSFPSPPPFSFISRFSYPFPFRESPRPRGKEGGPTFFFFFFTIIRRPRG
jgi:hypothetical protein